MKKDIALCSSLMTLDQDKRKVYKLDKRLK